MYCVRDTDHLKCFCSFFLEEIDIAMTSESPLLKYFCLFAGVFKMTIDAVTVIKVQTSESKCLI